MRVLLDRLAMTTPFPSFNLLLKSVLRLLFIVVHGFCSADKIGPTMAVLRLDVQRNIEVSKQGILLSPWLLRLTAISIPC